MLASEVKDIYTLAVPPSYILTPDSITLVKQTLNAWSETNYDQIFYAQGLNKHPKRKYRVSS